MGRGVPDSRVEPREAIGGIAGHLGSSGTKRNSGIVSFDRGNGPVAANRAEASARDEEAAGGCPAGRLRGPTPTEAKQTKGSRSRWPKRLRKRPHEHRQENRPAKVAAARPPCPTSICCGSFPKLSPK